MQIERASFSRRRLSLTSLIDVIFLLLMFFMLSSTFTRFNELELVTAKSGGGASSSQPDIIMRLMPAGISVNGEIVALDQLAETLNRLIDSGAERAALIVDEDATTQTFVSTLETVRHIPDLSLTVLR